MERKKWGFWDFLGLIVVLSVIGDLIGGLLLPLLTIGGVVCLGAFLSMKASQKKEMRNSYTRRYTRTSSSDSQKVSRINAYLKKWFMANHSLPVADDIELTASGNNPIFDSLEVYKNHSYLCGMTEFRNRFPESYKIIVDELYERANYDLSQNGSQIIDVEAEVVSPQNQRKQNGKKKTEAEKFIEEINSLNTDIPDEKITQGLFETCAYLKQIDDLTKKLPNTREKLDKLYEHYLPILIKILKQYESLQVAVTDPSYQETREKLTNTIQLINSAMKNIISSMTDEDFINLSADISTLEAVLKKDGVTGENTMKTGTR